MRLGRPTQTAGSRHRQAQGRAGVQLTYSTCARQRKATSTSHGGQWPVFHPFAGATHASLQTRGQETKIYRDVEANSHDLQPGQLLGFAMQLIFPLQKTRLATHPCLPGPPFQDKSRRWLKGTVPQSPVHHVVQACLASPARGDGVHVWKAFVCHRAVCRHHGAHCGFLLRIEGGA